MVFVGVSALGKTSLHFVDPGTKINGKYRECVADERFVAGYPQLFRVLHFPAGWGSRTSSTRDCRSAEARDARLHSAHTMAAQQSRLKPCGLRRMGDLAGPRLQERDQGRGVEELHQRIQEEWDSLDQRVIDSAVREWRKRLQSCVAANGEHFAHKL